MSNQEKKRLERAHRTFGGDTIWEKWGPYVSERSWGTVREDYSADGNAWAFFPFEHATSRAYRWGEDGIAGICDRYQVLVLSWAFWNGNDSILKERLFGLNAWEANHGEDVKEYYYHVDNTPTHSYMKYVYKYPHAEFPYQNLIEENNKRTTKDREYELLDTGVFAENRYFDIEIEYAKASPDDICIRLEIFNRGPETAQIDVIPQLVFRNTWSWEEKHKSEPVINRAEAGDGLACLVADDTDLVDIPHLTFQYKLGKRYLYGSDRANLLFTNNETNKEKLFGEKSHTKFVKDAFHRHIIHKESCVNTKEVGTKACFHYSGLSIPSKESFVLYFRLTDEAMEAPLEDVDQIIKKRKKEADDFYEDIHPKNLDEDTKKIQRQALSGMLWNKQIYLYDVNTWLKGDNPQHPMPAGREHIRNFHWRHLISKRILSMPDKWEYPWFAAWDLAFHTVALALADIEFSKNQIWFLLFDQFQHPNGQVPAYEWEFSELNPPVQAWAAYRVFSMEYKKTGRKDYSFLKKVFHKLILNFVWWVNKVDSKGNNVFEGGFLGLDNITVIDRSAEIPGGGSLEQSDGTGWMGLFCLLLMRISFELAQRDSDYEPMVIKFFEHFVYIANALDRAENREVQLWDEEDGFFYDVICYPNNTHQQIKVRSLVGIIPLFAIDFFDEAEMKQLEGFYTSFIWFCNNRNDIVNRCVIPCEKDGKKRFLFSLMPKDRIERVLQKVWDPNEFRSEYGLRSLSKVYENNPYELLGNSISYEPGEAVVILKGGNSNWRGPLWFPTTFLFIDAMKRLHEAVGDGIRIRIEDERPVNTGDIAEYFGKAMIKLFHKDENGLRPIYDSYEMMQRDPFWKDYILFYEHYHGDSGRGLGASHQCGWSGLVANLIDEWYSQK